MKSTSVHYEHGTVFNIVNDNIESELVEGDEPEKNTNCNVGTIYEQLASIAHVNHICFPSGIASTGENGRLRQMQSELRTELRAELLKITNSKIFGHYHWYQWSHESQMKEIALYWQQSAFRQFVLRLEGWLYLKISWLTNSIRISQMETTVLFVFLYPASDLCTWICFSWILDHYFLWLWYPCVAVLKIISLCSVYHLIYYSYVKLLILSTVTKLRQRISHNCASFQIAQFYKFHRSVWRFETWQNHFYWVGFSQLPYCFKIIYYKFL